MDHSDPELVAAIRAGSTAAFETLMTRYQRLVYRVSYGITGEHESAMDVVQEAFLKVHARLEGWRGEGELRNWIVRIAANEALNRSRAERLHLTGELDEERIELDEPSPEQALRLREAHGALHRGLSSLTARHRLALVLRYFQGMSAREIGGVLECSEGTARNLLCRGLRRLRSALSGLEERSLP